MKVISLVIAIFGFGIITTAQNNKTDTSYWSGDKIMKGGFFLDGNLGFMSLTERWSEMYGNSYNYKTEEFGVGINVGSKFYFGQSKTHRLGISVSGGFDVYMEKNDFFDPTFIIAPLNLGFTNIWKINNTRAFEANLNFGPKINVLYGSLAIGINPEVRYRLKKFTLGIGYSLDLPINSRPNGMGTGHRVNLIIGIR